MQKDKQESQNGLPEIGLGLYELLLRGARRVIQQAIEAEQAELLAQYANVKTLSGRQALVRNGYLPEHDIVSAAEPVTVKVAKMRDRASTGVNFKSSVIPPYVRKPPRVSAALFWLYLKGILTVHMGDALSVLLSGDGKGLSANVVHG